MIKNSRQMIIVNKCDAAPLKQNTNYYLVTASNSLVLALLKNTYYLSLVRVKSSFILALIDHSFEIFELKHWLLRVSKNISHMVSR